MTGRWGTMPRMPSSLPDGRRLGAHLPVANGTVAAAERAHAIGAATLQIFADNPTAWRRRSEPPADLPAFRERLSALDLGPVAIHASYLINLAGPDDAFWGRSVEVLASELRTAPAFGARFVNMHIGSHRLTGLAEGLDRIGTGVARALAQVDAGPDAALLALENRPVGAEASACRSTSSRRSWNRSPGTAAISIECACAWTRPTCVPVDWPSATRRRSTRWWMSSTRGLAWSAWR